MTEPAYRGRLSWWYCPRCGAEVLAAAERELDAPRCGRDGAVLHPPGTHDGVRMRPIGRVRE